MPPITKRPMAMPMAVFFNMDEPLEGGDTGYGDHSS
jgi:hypothetical protein